MLSQHFPGQASDTPEGTAGCCLPRACLLVLRALVAGLADWGAGKRPRPDARVLCCEKWGRCCQLELVSACD